MDAFPASKTVVPGPGLQVLDKPDALSVSSLKSVASTVSLDQPVHTGPQFSNASGSSVTDPPDSFVQQEPVLSDVELDPLPDRSDRDSGEEGELSDTEMTERNKETNYRETVRSVRAFLGWTHIPDFEPAVGDTDNHYDNPWKGKYPDVPARCWLNCRPTTDSAIKWRNSTRVQQKVTPHALKRPRV